MWVDPLEFCQCREIYNTQAHTFFFFLSNFPYIILIWSFRHPDSLSKCVQLGRLLLSINRLKRCSEDNVIMRAEIVNKLSAWIKGKVVTIWSCSTWSAPLQLKARKLLANIYAMSCGVFSLCIRCKKKKKKNYVTMVGVFIFPLYL